MCFELDLSDLTMMCADTTRRSMMMTDSDFEADEPQATAGLLES